MIAVLKSNVKRPETSKTVQAALKDPNRYPPGWDRERVRRLIQRYESQTDEEAIAEDEAAFEDQTRTTVEIPNELLPTVRKLLAQQPE